MTPARLAEIRKRLAFCESATLGGVMTFALYAEHVRDLLLALDAATADLATLRAERDEPREAALTIMVELTPLIAQAAIVGRTYGWPEVLGIVMAVKREFLKQQAERDAARARGTWQPIETAPKGVQILLSDGGDSTVGYWNGIVHRWIDACDENGFTFSRPTHWQPLPVPPATTDEEGA